MTIRFDLTLAEAAAVATVLGFAPAVFNDFIGMPLTTKGRSEFETLTRRFQDAVNENSKEIANE